MGMEPHLEEPAGQSWKDLSLVHKISVSAQLKVNIGERYFRRSLQPSDCRVTLGCFLARANFTSSDFHSLSCKLGKNIFNLLEYLVFFVECFSSLQQFSHLVCIHTFKTKNSLVAGLIHVLCSQWDYMSWNQIDMDNFVFILINGGIKGSSFLWNPAQAGNRMRAR